MFADREAVDWDGSGLHATTSVRIQDTVARNARPNSRAFIDSRVITIPRWMAFPSTIFLSGFRSAVSVHDLFQTTAAAGKSPNRSHACRTEHGQCMSVLDRSTSLQHMHRRELLQLVSAWSATSLVLPIASRLHALRIAVIRLVVISPRVTTGVTAARDRGVTLGIEEARHASHMFGGTIERVDVPADDADKATREIATTAVLGGDDAATCLALADVARANGCLHLNLTCPADTLRNADCRSRSFHVAPSEAMLRDAAGEQADARAAAWDPTLAKYGADTLNRRFEARFSSPMTSEAWCGWMAVKVIWEASLRARSTDATTLARFLESNQASFDGHKGRALSFRTWDHQLRQPVYVARPGRPVAEIPTSTNADEPSRDVLDRIGTTGARSSCRWSGR
jgi:hypothetical protein